MHKKTIVERTMMFYLFAIMAIFTSCRPKDESSLSNLYITFKVDSTKIYDAQDVPKGIFIFSPLQSNDRIWTINTQNPHELDLKTGEWSPLTSKFGNVLKRQIREDGIWRDKYTGETYISCFHGGLIRYHPEKDTFALLKIFPVTAFYPRKENIIIGTANGLYFLNRMDNDISVAENFPLDIWVNAIQESSNDTLLINNKYYYHITSNAVSEKNIGKSTPEKSTNYIYISQEVSSKLPSLSGGFREFWSDSISWYYSDSELFYSTNKNDFYKFPLFPEGHVRHILEDKKYLYVLFNEIFVILNKDYIFKNSLIHEVANYKELRKELLQKRDELNESKIDIDKYLAESVTLYNDEKYAGYSDLQNILQNIPNSLEYYSYEQDIGNLNSILENDTIPIVFKYNILKGLCRKYTTSAKLDSALIYFHLIKELHPSYKDYCIDSSYPCVATAKKQLDSIRSENISADRLLFFEAKAREKMIHCSCWFGNSWYNYSIVEDKYQELLNSYPNSEYADDAEFWMINYQNYIGEEGGYSVSEIPNIRKFVSKYPNSDLIPNLLMNIAYSYSNNYSENVDNRIKNIEQGIEELIKLKNNYQLDSIEFARVEQNLLQFEHQKNELIYTLTVIPLKNDYKMNEDIEVEITISNNSSTPKTIELYANESYVSFKIHPDKNVKFIPIDDDDATKKQFSITRGEPIKQKVKLNSLVRHWDGGKLGGFNFEEEGLYYLTCFSRENSLSSNQVKIYVKK
jgi:hypothetical protein